MKEPVLTTIGNNFVTIVVIALAAFGAILIMIFDDSPNPRPPQCHADEVPMPVERKWWCVPARKP